MQSQNLHLAFKCLVNKCKRQTVLIKAAFPGSAENVCQQCNIPGSALGTSTLSQNVPVL